jgi:hypothetical protein
MMSTVDKTQLKWPILTAYVQPIEDTDHGRVIVAPKIGALTRDQADVLAEMMQEHIDKLKSQYTSRAYSLERTEKNGIIRYTCKLKWAYIVQRDVDKKWIVDFSMPSDKWFRYATSIPYHTQEAAERVAKAHCLRIGSPPKDQLMKLPGMPERVKKAWG